MLLSSAFLSPVPTEGFRDTTFSANSVQRQLRDLSNKISLALLPVFVSKKLDQDLKPREAKPSIVNQ